MAATLLPDMQPNGGSEGLQFGVAIRPPRMTRHDTRFSCSQIDTVQEDSLATLGAAVTVVRRGNFLGVVAADAKTASQAAAKLKVTWSSSDAPEPAPGHTMEVVDDAQPHSYTWPSRLPRGDWRYVVADSRSDGIHIWGNTRTPDALRRDIALLCDCAPEAVKIISSQTEGAIRGIEDDAAADAALMSLIVQTPVAVMPDGEGAHSPEQLGDVYQIDWRAALAAGQMRSVTEVWHGQARTVPALALLLARQYEQPARPQDAPSTFVEAGPYNFDTYRRILPDPPGDPLWDAPDSAHLPGIFARESFMDEMACEAGVEPLAWRRRHLADARHQKLLDAVSRAAPPKATPPDVADSKRLYGRGTACHFSGQEASAPRSVWIVDLEVDRATGAIELTRLLVGEDGGAADDNTLLQSRLEQMLLGQDNGLLNSVAKDSSDWEMNRTPLPAVERVTLPSVQNGKAGEQPLAALAPQRVAPGVAAVANAIFDATGIRMRKPPFDAPRMRSVMTSQGLLQHDGRQQETPARRWARWAFMAAVTIIGAGIAVINPFRDALPKREAISAFDLYSQSAIDRGRMVAAAGDCAVCHTTAQGLTNVGGRAFETPFGTVYSTNITPDPGTGIGSWSFVAFERAMRKGISRNGSHLYPVFPYTAYAKLSDADMHALYAYLMSRQPVTQAAPENRLRFPFSYRPLMAVWNALFLQSEPLTPEPSQSALYNRGKYLSEGLGHCAACHSPRNILGAEKKGAAHLAGGLVDGWDAPALNHLSAAPLTWSEQDLYDYLRTGQSQRHGAASGPMKPVLDELTQLSNWDIRAIAHYISTYSAGRDAVAAATTSHRASAPQQTTAMYQGQTLFDKACASCHEASPIPRFDQATVDLALNTNLHAESPNNVLQTIINGIDAHRDIAAMPAFGANFTDQQIIELTRYMRQRFAPNASKWQNIPERLREIRGSAQH